MDFAQYWFQVPKIDPPSGLGAAFQGGYYAGQINDGGTIYYLIVAPRTSGSLEGQHGGSTPSYINWKTSTDGPDTTAQNEVYGAPAMLANSSTTFPVFNWCKSGATGPNAGTYDATNTIKTGIGGFNDWYIPAKNELEIVYRNLKPDTRSNDMSSGANPNAVPSATSNYTSGSPGQTSVSIFRSGGSEAFNEGEFYWTATEVSSSPSDAGQIGFGDGYYRVWRKAGNDCVRAIRRVPA